MYIFSFMKEITITTFLLLVSYSVCFSQGTFTVPVHAEVAAKQGNTIVLQGKTIKVVFVYDGMKVGDLSEKDNISSKVANYNAKQPGRGDAWLKEWVGNRADFFEPSFVNKFNEMGKKTHTLVKKNTDSYSAFTLVITTTFTEPGSMRA